MVYAGILAGGLGWGQTKEEMPKQFTLIGNKPIIIHTIEQFLINPSVDKIIVAAPENWIIYTRDLIKKNILATKEIHVVAGGSNKNNTISKIVDFINEQYGITEKDILINHDAIRPFVTQRIIDDNIAMVKKYDSANTAVPTIDTIIKAGKDGKVDEITSERIFYSEQTPQTFVLQKLYEVYKKEGISRKYVNAIKMFIETGNSVRLVEGEYSNIKIVTQFDIEMANSILRANSDDK